jgi:5-formyltetrahydrofolate cyclo-ligase
MQSSTPAVEQLKSDIRLRALAERDAMPADLRSRAAQAIADRPLPFPMPAGAIVAGFMPLRSEINPLPLMRRLVDAGGRLALPVVAGRGKPLIMRAFAFGDPLVAGVWGIRQPGQRAKQVDPDILIVPLLAFDRTGHRIGYGAGYYDRTITALRALKPVLAAGLGFAVQEIERVPRTERDAHLDLVLTERETIDCRPA